MSEPKVSIRQLKAARALLGWSQVDLAEALGGQVSLPTIKRIEASDGELAGRADTITAIVGALEKAGVIFLEANGDGEGVRIKYIREL